MEFNVTILFFFLIVSLFYILCFEYVQTKKSKYTSHLFFPKILGGSYKADVCSSIHFYDQFGFD